VFWFTAGIGVVFEDDDPRAYGAGILSSYGGARRLPGRRHPSFDFAAMGTAEYDITH